MISDSQLYSLAIFLGSSAMLLIVLYHFLEVNSEDHIAVTKAKSVGGKARS
jgi:oligosaccharyl transferase complex subunit OST4